MVSPEQDLSGDGRAVTTKMSVTTEDDVTVYRSNSENFATWIQVSLGFGVYFFVLSVCIFFFFSFPSYISGVHHFWVRFLRM